MRYIPIKECMFRETAPLPLSRATPATLRVYVSFLCAHAVVSKTASMCLLERTTECELTGVHLTLSVHSVCKVVVSSGVNQQALVPLTDAHNAL